MALIIYSGTGEDDGGGKGTVMGEADSVDQALMLASTFPGSGQCHVWSPDEQRIVHIVTWENRRKAN